MTDLHRVHVLRDEPASSAAQPLRAVQRRRHDSLRRRLPAARLGPTLKHFFRRRRLRGVIS
jgi:hypothetical protein